MTRPPRRRRAPRPLDAAALQELAIAYVGRFATTRGRLRAYLARKLRERGWAEEQPAEVEALVARIAANGFVDDSAWAMAKTQALTGRGYGDRRVGEALRAAGVEEADGAAALSQARNDAASAALRFAQRRRIGPFATRAAERQERDRAIAAMLRAGHGFALARAIVDLAPGDDPDLEQLKRLGGAD